MISRHLIKELASSVVVATILSALCAAMTASLCYRRPDFSIDMLLRETWEVILLGFVTLTSLFFFTRKV